MLHYLDTGKRHHSTYMYIAIYLHSDPHIQPHQVEKLGQSDYVWFITHSWWSWLSWTIWLYVYLQSGLCRVSYITTSNLLGAYHLIQAVCKMSFVWDVEACVCLYCLDSMLCPINCISTKACHRKAWASYYSAYAHKNSLLLMIELFKKATIATAHGTGFESKQQGPGNNQEQMSAWCLLELDGLLTLPVKLLIVVSNLNTWG